MTRKKKWINLSNDEQDSSDEEWEEPEPTINVFEISALTTSAYEDTTHPLPTISRSWISPDLQRFHSRKAAVSYAQQLVERDVLIDRVLYGYGKNGVRLRPVKPTRKAALEAGMARFLRDGLWIVGQEEMWIEGRRERFNRKNKMLLGGKDRIRVDEGDPPWRTGGHDYLSRRVRWTPTNRNTGLKREPAVGTVMGWISESDVDSKGNPGFVSNKTGKPASLFRVLFDNFEQDFEEFELEPIFCTDERELNSGEVSNQELNDSANKQETGCDGVVIAANEIEVDKDATNAKPIAPATSRLYGDNNKQSDQEVPEEKSSFISNDGTNCDGPSISSSSDTAISTVEALSTETSSAAAAGPSVATPVAQDTAIIVDNAEASSDNYSLTRVANSDEDAGQAQQTKSQQLEAVLKSRDNDKFVLVKVSIMQSTDTNNVNETKTVITDSDASTEGEAKKVTKPRALRNYIEPLPPSTHYRLNSQQIQKCYAASTEHYDKVMYTVKARSLHHELADGFDVLRERGKGRYDMELPQFDTEEYSFLTDLKKAAWMPIIHKILGEDAILVHKGCFLSLPGSETQVYHQDGVHLHKKIQKPCHAVNVFIPLVDYDMSNGPTQFCLGSHYLGHENFVKEMAYTPLVEAGTPVIFDYRLGHRGLRNYSENIRPVVYLTYSAVASGKEFRDEVNFSRRRYRKLGEFAEKPLSREERSKKRRTWYM